MDTGVVLGSLPRPACPPGGADGRGVTRGTSQEQVSWCWRQALNLPWRDELCTSSGSWEIKRNLGNKRNVLQFIAWRGWGGQVERFSREY